MTVGPALSRPTAEHFDTGPRARALQRLFEGLGAADGELAGAESAHMLGELAGCRGDDSDDAGWRPVP